jgi:hypothetical protein
VLRERSVLRDFRVQLEPRVLGDQQDNLVLQVKEERLEPREIQVLLEIPVLRELLEQLE